MTHEKFVATPTATDTSPTQHRSIGADAVSSVATDTRFWIVSELYYPETAATGYILTKLAEGVAKNQSNVKVLCGQPTYRDRGVRAPDHEVHNGVEIFRAPSTTLNKDILPLRLINLVTITFSLFFATLRRLRHNDRVLVVTNPPTLPFLVAMACKLRGAHCMLLIHDAYPEVLVATGKLPADGLATRWLGWLNKQLYNSMDTIIAIGRDMQELAIAKLDDRPDRVKVVTNWADLDLIRPQPRAGNSFLNELNLEDKFVLQYAGNMGQPNDIEAIVEAAVLLIEEPQIHFVFLGGGAKKNWIEQMMKVHGLTNVSLVPTRPRSDQPNFLNGCDVAVISLIDGMKGVSVPSRTYNTLASGKPIMAIAEPGSELALVVDEEDAGWVVSPNQPAQLAATILAAAQDPAAALQKGANARAAAERAATHLITFWKNW